jgi:hypothetical protein
VIGKAQFIPLVSLKLREGASASLRGMKALCKAHGQQYAAGPGKVVQFDEGAISAPPIRILRTVQVPLKRIGGLSAYAPGSLLVGDGATNTVHMLHLATGRLLPLFRLNQLKTQINRARSVLPRGVLSALGFDGAHVFAAVQAGYSSSILKINPATKQVVAHAWAPGPQPTAMHHDGKDLFVLDGREMLLRRYDANLQLSYKAVKVPSDTVGLIVDKPAEFRTLGPEGMRTFRADLSKLRELLRRADLRPLPRVQMRPLFGRRYAVLVCGDVAESGWPEFWYDTIWMYKTLRNAGYSADSIYVLYGNGIDYACANPNYSSTETVTDFAATVANMTLVLDGLKNGDAAHGIQKLTDRDSLLVWTFDHGGGLPPYNYLCFMDGDYYASTFATKLDALSYARRVFLMQQCRSGGFIAHLQNNRTFISTAARGNEDAFPADTERETWGGQQYRHGEYNYYIISALAGVTPFGTSAAAADTNGNGSASALEAHQWMATNENRVEVPQFNDMGGVGAAFHIK